MKEYVTISLETHLFFGRIMREHALERTVLLANGMVSESVLHSGEVFTEFTEMAEQQTSKLTKIPINVRITQAEKNLRAGRGICPDRRMVQNVRQNVN